MFIIWNLVGCAFVAISTVLAGENDHIHIKLHLPELLKKHSHVKTVYKHHYHPTKTINSHLVKDTLGGNKIELDGSFSTLNPIYSMPHSNGFTQFDIPKETWLTHGDVDVFEVKPKFKPFSFNNNYNNWANSEVYSKLLMPQKQFQQQYQMDDSQDYDSDPKMQDQMKDYENDEDEEYLMTEDSIREQPLAVQMQIRESLGHGMPTRFKNGGMWNHPVAQPDLNTAPTEWTQHLNNENYMAMARLAEMQRYQALKNLMESQGAYVDSNPVAMLKGKKTNKGRSKKKKRLNSQRKANNNFVYPVH